VKMKSTRGRGGPKSDATFDETEAGGGVGVNSLWRAFEWWVKEEDILCFLFSWG
jgi:hypothetical protein